MLDYEVGREEAEKDHDLRAEEDRSSHPEHGGDRL